MKKKCERVGVVLSVHLMEKKFASFCETHLLFKVTCVIIGFSFVITQWLRRRTPKCYSFAAPKCYSFAVIQASKELWKSSNVFSISALSGTVPLLENKKKSYFLGEMSWSLIIMWIKFLIKPKRLIIGMKQKNVEINFSIFFWSFWHGVRN